MRNYNILINEELNCDLNNSMDKILLNSCQIFLSTFIPVSSNISRLIGLMELHFCPKSLKKWLIFFNLLGYKLSSTQFFLLTMGIIQQTPPEIFSIYLPPVSFTT